MRSKQIKPSKYSGAYKKYSTDNIQKALEEHKSTKCSIRKVAKQYNIPYQTLRDRINGRNNTENYGNDTLLTHEEELALVEEAEHSALLGYGYTNKGFQRAAGQVAHMLGRRPTDKALSNCWLYGFLQRWKSRLSSVKPASLESYRARQTTPENVYAYFSNLEKTIKDNDLLDKPHLIYNMDETGISPEHRPANIIAPKEGKAQTVTSPRTSSTTLIGCANAAGNHLPPYFVFKGKRMNEELMVGTSPGSRATMSDSGWSNTDVFRSYLEDHFLPNISQRSDGQKVLLILDGHTTHTSRQMIEWALTKGIILFILPAHSSHILQPLDVAVFGPFKRYYYSECASYMRDNMGKIVTRYEMGAIACKAYLRAMNPSNIVSAFRKTGIFPLNKDAVSMEKMLPCEAFRDSTPIQKLKAMKMGKEAVELYLEEKALKQSPCTPCNCKKSKARTQSLKPNPGGKEITCDSFIRELDLYEAEKENSTVPQRNTSKSYTTGPLSPQPTTSGLQNIMIDSDEDSEPEETDLCCVCNKLSPPNLNDKPHLKIVTWAQCDKCDHWVHLAFCHTTRVIRRGDEFFCKHCC